MLLRQATRRYYPMAALSRMRYFTALATKCTSRLSSSIAFSPPAPASTDLKVGDERHGYRVQRSERIESMEVTATLLEHLQTGARHLHMSKANDPNNVFGVAFRTLPTSKYHDTGVAHILEHTVMCGSKNYPVRDPFFKMLTRSLSSFMNAMTASDWTLYPFSSPNHKDFSNLLDVYLDLTFQPQLRYLDFCQEGIRLQPDDLQDAQSAIDFKGVVFNEMKGVFSNPDNLFERKQRNLLLPIGTYSFESGGDPLAIPELTWQMLRDFYATSYHPTNARFFTYGNLPVEDHLRVIDDRVLSKSARLSSQPDSESAVPPQPRWTDPRRSTIHCKPDPLASNADKQDYLSVSYLLPSIDDPLQNIIMHVIGELLTSGPKAPFYRTLLQSGLGSDYTPGTGLDVLMKEAKFSIGLKHIASGDVDAVESIIHQTLEQTVEEGFDAERVEAILHHFELAQRHDTGNFGLHLMFNVITPWIHDADPVSFCQFDQLISRFRQALANEPRLLEQKVREWLVENPHRMTLHMTPREDFAQRAIDDERKLLAKKVSALNDADREEIRATSERLRLEQDEQQDLSVLPCVTLADIRNEPEPCCTSASLIRDSVPFYLTDSSTNNVTYFRAFFRTSDLSSELRPFVPLFTNIVTEMGAGPYDYRDLSQQIDLKSGGFNAVSHVIADARDPNRFEDGVTFSSYSLSHNDSDMLRLWRLIMTQLRLTDTEQFANLVRMTASNLSSSLADSGHAFAMTHAESHLRSGAALKEQWDGIAQVNHMRRAAAECETVEGCTVLLDKMRQIAEALFDESLLRLSLTGRGNQLAVASDNARMLVDELQSEQKSTDKACATEAHFVSKEGVHTYHEMPFDVHYAGVAFPSVAYTHDDYAPLRVLARLLTFKNLHKEVREKGGAYGGGARASPGGTFSFYSYRDPHNVETLDAFQRSITWASEGNFTETDVDEAKLNVFSEIDKPVAPGNRGLRLFLNGISDEQFQRHRQALLAVDRRDLLRAVQFYFNDRAEQRSCTTILGPKCTQLRESENWIVK